MFICKSDNGWCFCAGFLWLLFNLFLSFLVVGGLRGLNNNSKSTLLCLIFLESLFHSNSHILDGTTTFVTVLSTIYTQHTLFHINGINVKYCLTVQVPERRTKER